MNCTVENKATDTAAVFGPIQTASIVALAILGAVASGCAADHMR